MWDVAFGCIYQDLAEAVIALRDRVEAGDGDLLLNFGCESLLVGFLKIPAGLRFGRNQGNLYSNVD